MYFSCALQIFRQIFVIATIFGALVILFLALVFFSLLSDALGYFVSLYREIVFRLH